VEETTHSGSVNTEAKFTINELFFSITSRDSTILSGNDVFIRISGYSKEELVGKYHNIIRHPDMPKIVFKTLWDYLDGEKPIVAYVKNRAKNGDYYWVLAAVFPLKEEYVSIRLKPSNRLFSVVKELYPQLLEIEHEKGVEESKKALAQQLNALGYNDYDHFMGDALLQELQGRQELLSLRSVQNKIAESASPLHSYLTSAHGYTQALMGVYEGWFEKINIFIQTKSMFEEKSLILREVAREIIFLSLNASVSSYKIASGGETFGILARDIRTNAKENDALITHIDSLVHTLSDALNNTIFSVSGIRLQTEMLSCFIEERLCEEGSLHCDEISKSMDILFALVAEYSSKLTAWQLQIDKQLQEIQKYLDQLEQQMMYLGYVQVYGIIEAAGNRHETVSFEGIFLQLKGQIEMTGVEVTAMRKMAESFSSENRYLMNTSVGVENLIARLEIQIGEIKKQGFR